MRKTITAMLLAGTIALPALVQAQEDHHGGGDRPHAEGNRGGGAPRPAPAPAPAPRPAFQPQAQAQARAAAPAFQPGQHAGGGDRRWAGQPQGFPNTAAGTAPRPDWHRGSQPGGYVPQDATRFAPGQQQQNGNFRGHDAQRPQAFQGGGIAQQGQRYDQQRFAQQRGDDQHRDGRRDDGARHDDGQRRGYDQRRDDGQRREAYADGRRDGWNRGWHQQQDYNWQRYRAENRFAYHLPRYYAPYGWGYGYRRFGIGFTLSNVLFAQDYWIDDPYDYRLPPAYGPYRWVRYYNDALLVDIRTGQVVDTVYDMFW